MIRDEPYRLVVNPESVNELYDLFTDPHELRNHYEHHELRPVRLRLMRRPYGRLRERGDNFYHWTPMYDIGASDHDPSLSIFELEDTP